MKKESRLLLAKAVNSLILSIEHFNRPFDTGRVEAVLILLDHSFEMFLKSALLHCGARIREGNSKQTIGFDACVRKALTGVSPPILTDEQVLSLQIVNSLRDAAQHHLVEVSEDQLYIHAQAGLTLFRDLLKSVFSQELYRYMPARVLPISMTPPSDLSSLFDREVKSIQKLLSPKKRKRTEALAKVKALAIVEGAVMGESVQPSDINLNVILSRIKHASSWQEVFPGVAVLDTTAVGSGPAIDLRITKKEGVPVHLVKEGTPGASVIAVKRIDELGFYHLSPTQLAEKIGLTLPKMGAVVRYAKIKEDSTCYKEVTMGKSKFSRYSTLAIEKANLALKEKSANDIWRIYHKPKYEDEP